MLNMKTSIAIFFFLVAALFGWLIYSHPPSEPLKYYGGADRLSGGSDSQSGIVAGSDSRTELSVEQSPATDTPPAVADNGFFSPLGRVSERVTKKPFGILVDPANSPVRPERFRGYHTGTDFEILPGEEQSEVPVKAVCDGRIDFKRMASGYGGLLVQICQLDGQSVSIVYGHLELESIRSRNGANVKHGDIIGVLGSGGSVETDGERKHLHLAFFRGRPADLRGYVPEQSQLEDWADPCLYACQ